MKEAVTLFGTGGCHLCEEALALLHATLNPDFFTISEIDIADSDAMVEQYGVRIPVLRRDLDGSELNWPFGVEELIAFLSGE